MFCPPPSATIRVNAVIMAASLLLYSSEGDLARVDVDGQFEK